MSYFSCKHTEYPEHFLKSVYFFVQWDWSLKELDWVVITELKRIKAPVCNITSFSREVLTWPYISLNQTRPLHFIYPDFPEGEKALERNIVRLPFDGNESGMSFIDVSHIPGGSLEHSLLPIPPWAAHTNARIRSVYSFGLHAPSSSHVGGFGAVCLNNNHWNATMSHSKVSFKAHCQPPTTNPHIFSRQNKVVETSPSLVLFFPGVSWTYKIKSEASVFSLYWEQKITAHTLRVCQCSLQVFCVVTFSLAVGSIFWGALKRCDKVGAGL